jgi:hypothetical protein
MIVATGPGVLWPEYLRKEGWRKLRGKPEEGEENVEGEKERERKELKEGESRESRLTFITKKSETPLLRL